VLLCLLQIYAEQNASPPELTSTASNTISCSYSHNAIKIRFCSGEKNNMAVGLVAVLTPEEADLQFRRRRSCAVVVMMAGYGCDGRAKPQWLLAAEISEALMR
jgi:hypothetical protein